MSNPSIGVVQHDSAMNNNIPERPRSGGPTRRRSITPAQKLVHLAAYDLAIATIKGGAYLREQGSYSSQITEWRKLRDAGVLAGKQPGEKIGKLTPEQVEIVRLKRKLELTNQRLATTEAALEIMSKMHELLENLFDSSRDQPPQTKQ
jgi:transposase-like protein